MLPLVDERPDGLDGLMDDACGVDQLPAELDLALRDAGDVEQVVDEDPEVAGPAG